MNRMRELLSSVRVHPWVFGVSAVLVLLFVVLGGVFSGPMGVVLDWLLANILSNFGWFYIASVAGFLVFVVWLFFSRYGRIKLGKDQDEPVFSYVTWFAMLFSAGMGIGLLFFSVAEPVMHFTDPPREVLGEPGSSEYNARRANQAMSVSFFHWGVHAWAIYIIVALSLAYFSFRHGLPLSIRSALYPLIGRRVFGPIGNLVDILAVFGTLFGLATSLGLGVMQINAGLNYLGLLEITVANQVWLIAAVTLAATISVATGLERGIRRLSELNLGAAALLLAFVLITGPTVFLLHAFIQNVGTYLSSLVEMTFRTDAFLGLQEVDRDWQQNWTMFYWAWWISWSPFVGMFIARISRGRTIREFIGGVLLVPTLLTFFFLTVFGDTALWLQMERGVDMSGIVSADISVAIFAMLQNLAVWPVVFYIMAGLAVLVIAIFFITSADSGSLVIDTITSGDHPERPAWQRVFWALIAGSVAAVLLLSGGLAALQTAAITTALPFVLVMVVICWGLVRGLRAEVQVSSRLGQMLTRLRGRVGRQRGLSELVGPQGVPSGKPPEADGVGEPMVTESAGQAAVGWEERLKGLMGKVDASRQFEPSLARAEQRVREFISQTVEPAFEQIAGQLEQYGRRCEIASEENEAMITVYNGNAEEFTYAIHARVHHRMSFAFPEQAVEPDGPTVERAEVVLRSGKHREHEIREWTHEGIIEDFLQAYTRWMGW